MAKHEKLENNEVKFEIEVAAERFAEGLQKAFQKTGKRYNVPGFRKGKAPRKMIEKMYGDAVFYEAAFDEVYWDPYIEAVNEAKFVPVDVPNISIEEIGEGKDLRFTAIVAVKPEIKVLKKDYKGLEVEKVDYPATDAEVDHELEHQRERLARYVEVDRPVKEGDQVNINYSGSIDGVVFDGGTAENQTLNIGSNTFIPGFEEQLIGKKAGEEFDIKVTFPEEYHAKDLAGKEATFAVVLNEVKEKELPELDDEFAKDMSDFDTLDEYRADLRKKMEEYNDERAKREMRNAVLEALVEKNQFAVPKAMVDRQIQNAIADMRHRLSHQGMSLEDYLGFTGSDMAQFEEQIRPDAEKRVRADLLLEQIVKNEEISATEKEIDEEIEALAKNVQKTVEETKELLSERDMEAIKNDMAMSKAIQFLLDEAKMLAKKVEKEAKKDEKNVDKEIKTEKKARKKVSKTAEAADKAIEKVMEKTAKDVEKLADKADDEN